MNAELKEQDWERFDVRSLRNFMQRCLLAAGADEASADAVARSLSGASLRGVDSHGLRLLPHYLKVLKGGRINAKPQLTFTARSATTGVLDGDDCFGHLAGYRAVEEAMAMAKQSGMGAVTVTNSSHFGAAGSYPLIAAEQGYVALALSNSDMLVLAHDSVAPFHGTNPISFAAPVEGEEPYLIDMATSSIPYNRVLHYRSIHRNLPEDVAVDEHGDMTIDPLDTQALLPLGGRSYGYKGAALGGICEVLCSALTGMAFSHQLLAMSSSDISTPRGLGHFFLVMKLDAFVDPQTYYTQIGQYLNDLRSQQAVEGKSVMAAGDREWTVQRDRLAGGVPVDPPLLDSLSVSAGELGVAPL